MFAWARKLLGLGGGAPLRAPAQAPVRARYDNAQYTDENRRNWWMADVLSAKAANSFQVRRQLRMRSRYEVANNPYLFGVCNSNADDLIGHGPTLKVLSPSTSYNRRVEAAWSAWAAEVGLAEKLRTCKLAKSVDGEGFLVLKTVSDLESPVKLYPVDVEADQVTTPAPANLADLWVDGLTLHPVTGRPVSYHVLKHHPGDYFFPDFNPLRVDVIAKKWVVHWFQQFRPGQVRGVPVFTSALDLFTELRAFRKAVLGKAQIAANLTAVVQTQAPANTDDVDAGTVTANGASQPFDSLPIDRGMMTTLPWGATLQQFTSGDPSTTYEMFQEKCLGEACRPLNYPLNLALGTSQKFNFSSAKLDHVNYREGLTVERGQCETEVLGPIFRAWLAEAVLTGAVPRGATLANTPIEWHWPGFPALDPLADTQADIARINAGVLTWREFWATRGYDWREMMAQQSLEHKEIERLNLSFGEPMKKSEKVDETEENGDKGKPPKKADARPPRPRVLAADTWDEDSHPRDDDGRFAGGGEHAERHSDWRSEDKDHEELHEEKVSQAEGRHEKEEAALEAKHDKEDAPVEKARDKEDAATEAKREKEDATHEARREKQEEAIDKARQKEDSAIEARHEKEDAAVEKSREKEDAAVEKSREKEDAAADAAREKVSQDKRDKEDAATEKARAAEDKAIEKGRARADAADGKARDKQDAADGDADEARQKEIDKSRNEGEKEIERERKADHDSAEANGKGDEAEDAEHEAIDARHDAALEKHTEEHDARDQAETDRVAQRDAETVERRDKADKADEERRDKEDAGREAARDKEDAETAARREAEDEAHDAGDTARDAARAKEDDDRAAARDKEDTERTDARDKEDADLQARREGEDAAREKEDADRLAAREKADADTAARRAAEDESREHERAKERHALGEKHAQELERLKQQHEREREERSRARKEEDAAAHESYYAPQKGAS